MSRLLRAGSLLSLGVFVMIRVAAASEIAAAEFAGTLQGGERREHVMAVPTGTLVEGTLTGRGVRLQLLAADGQPRRLLADGKTERGDFMVLADRESLHLAVTGSTASGYRPELHAWPVHGAVPDNAVHMPESPRLRAVLAHGDNSDFWQEQQAAGTPLLERTGVEPPLGEGEWLVTFLWRGARHDVSLLGAPFGEIDPLLHLPGSDIWYRSYRVPGDSRLTYKLAPDVPQVTEPSLRPVAILATLQRDPLNPRSFPEQPEDIYDGESVLELPAAPPQSWLTPRPPAVAGSLDVHRLSSRLLGNTRDVFLYRAPGYRPRQNGQALLLLFDGEMHAGAATTTTLLDNLVAAGVLPPLAAIMVANPDRQTRARELPPNPEFSRFVAEELMPWAKAQGITASPTCSVISGASYGGLAAAYVGLAHPEWFGKVFSQSGSFWWAPEGDEAGAWMARQIAALDPVQVEFRLDAGRLESRDILDSNRHLRDVLTARGYRIAYHESSSGHDWYHWRANLAAGLIDLLGHTCIASR